MSVTGPGSTDRPGSTGPGGADASGADASMGGTSRADPRADTSGADTSMGGTSRADTSGAELNRAELNKAELNKAELNKAGEDAGAMDGTDPVHDEDRVHAGDPRRGGDPGCGTDPVDGDLDRPIRVAVVDNDRLVSAGLRTLLSETVGGRDIRVVSTAVDVPGFRHALRQAPAADPRVDVVLLDLQLEDGSQPAANVAALREEGLRVLVFSVHGDRRHVRATIRAGAGGYLVKDDDGAKLAEAIRTVHAGGLALTTDLMTLINDDPPELSAQELQVLYLYGTGSTLAATARRLGVAIPTVRSYLDRIRAKWAAVDEPVDDVRSLIHEYPPRPAGSGGRPGGGEQPRAVR